MRLVTCEGMPELVSTAVSSGYIDRAEAHRAAHEHDEAIKLYRRALTLSSASVAINYNFGLALQELGRHEEAIPRYERALVLDPRLAAAQNNLGTALHELGRQTEAFTHYVQALEIDRCLAEAHSNLGVLLKALGEAEKAIHHHQAAVRLRPGQATFHIPFIACLSDLRIVRPEAALRDDVIKTFGMEDVDHRGLAFPCASIVTSSADFASLVAFVDAADDTEFQALLDAGLDDVMSDKLFIALLKKTIVRDATIERVLTVVRSALLSMVTGGGPPGDVRPEVVAFVAALAHQCFANEYVYALPSTDAIRLHQLRALVLAGSHDKSRINSLLTATFACYAPLAELRMDEHLVHVTQTSPTSEIAGLVPQQIFEPCEERRLRAGIESVGSINDRVSKMVRAQYEENPYPRWFGVNRIPPQSVRRMVRTLFPHIPSDQIRDSVAPDVLVAGCGTGKQVLDKALELSSAKVVGIDISLTSLAYARRKAIDLGVPGVEFKHVDILNVGLLGKMFDIVECIGVLHHMHDPLAGWRALTSVVKPGGLMRIGLYSELARRDIAAAQSFVRETGYSASPDGIRDCRQHLLGMADGACVGAVTSVVDFYTLSEARDLLFHVHERRFSLFNIAEMLNELGLRFVGFESVEPREKARYVTQFPEDESATSLHNWHLYEQQHRDTFIGLYLFWVQKCA